MEWFFLVDGQTVHTGTDSVDRAARPAVAGSYN